MSLEGGRTAAAAPAGGPDGPGPERGLSSAEVRDRVARGLANDVPATTSRTVGQIVRANVLTPFNALLGSLLVLILIFGPPQDALFGGVLVVNTAIGIFQELRAKRTLDRLILLTAPKARAVRDGEVSEVEVQAVVLDDVLDLRPGDQVVVDGEVLVADGLEVDESLLTGESDPVRKSAGDGVLSGSFVAAGGGRYRATRVGAEAYASALAEEARRFTLVNSELRNGINRFIKLVALAMVPTGVLLVISQVRSTETFRETVRGTVAGLVAMVPEGLVLLTSVAFAVSVVRLARRRVLVQELPAVEVLARVDVLCIDKTGTITEGRLEVADVEPLGDGQGHVDALGALAAADSNPNATLRAIGQAFQAPEPSWTAAAGVPFSSARKWSATSFDGVGTWVLGAPDVLLEGLPAAAGLEERVGAHANAGRRVVLLMRSDDPLDGEGLPADRQPAALVVLSDRVHLGVAMGSGSPASKSVAQLVLLDGRFSSLPGVVAEGRRVLGNIERTSNLFLTKTVYAMVLALATGVLAFPFPFLPRHLTLVGSLTIGIPGFFIALMPSARRARAGMVPRVLRFAGPAGFVIAAATLAAYILVRNHGAGATLDESRTAATVVLFWLGTLVLVLVARPLTPFRRAIVLGMVLLFVAALALPAGREFFALDLPSLIVSFAAVGVAALCATGLELLLPRLPADSDDRR